jgi:uncharacterized protein (TIGR02246 family)
MRRFGLAFALLAAITLALGLVLAQQEDEQAIDDVRQQWVDLYNEGDTAGVADLYTEDAVVYDAVGEVQEGRDAIEAWVQENIDAGFVEVSAEAIRTEGMNDAAYQVGSYTFMDEEGETASEGYYLVIFERENDEWRLHQHIANMILPEEMLAAMMGEAPAAAPTEETEVTEEEVEEEVDEDAEVEVQQATVEVAEHDTYGEYLTDGEGRALYLFLNDEQGESTCYDQCAQNWPPLLTTEDAEAGEGVDSDLLGTTERDDGTTQVTYNDWPLYYFAADEDPGDVDGQGRGEVWYLVSPDGEAIEDEE